jgi:hypothetical protein
MPTRTAANDDNDISSGNHCKEGPIPEESRVWMSSGISIGCNKSDSPLFMFNNYLVWAKYLTNLYQVIVYDFG